MRNSLLVGLAVAVATVLVVLLGGSLDLALEPVVLLGATTGAVVALVPDRTAFARLVTVILGAVAAWVGYAVRAAVLPDTVGGRTVALVVVLGLVTAIAALSRGRLPLWAALLGAGVFAGAYERVYAAAPPELLATSATALTSLALTMAAGFWAAALVHRPVAALPTEHPSEVVEDDSLDAELDELLSAPGYGRTDSPAPANDLENVR